MQKKFGTVLDEKILDQARTYCRKQHTTISRLLETAVSEYLQRAEAAPSPFSTVEASFGALHISPKNLQSVLEEDIYDHTP